MEENNFKLTDQNIKLVPDIKELSDIFKFH